HVVVRVARHGIAKRGLGLRVPAEAVQREAQVHVRAGIFGTKANGFAKRRDGVVVAGELEPRASELGVCGDRLGKLARRLEEDGLGVSGAALTPKRDAEVEERREV